MTATYLQVTVAVWGFIAATALGVAIHTISSRRRQRAFTAHTIDALALLGACWPEPDDDCLRCGACGALWTPDRDCRQVQP